MNIDLMMGRIVIVDWEYKRSCEYEGSRTKKCWKKVQSDGRPGWVVGVRHLQQGVANYSGYDEGVVWRQTGPTTPCLLVNYWPTMNPVKVPLDGWRPASETISPYMSRMPWLPKHRKMLRNEMAHWPRNQYGQWEKKTGT
jgi:hypothetical protein